MAFKKFNEINVMISWLPYKEKQETCSALRVTSLLHYKTRLERKYRRGQSVWCESDRHGRLVTVARPRHVENIFLRFQFGTAARVAQSNASSVTSRNAASFRELWRHPQATLFVDTNTDVACIALCSRSYLLLDCLLAVRVCCKILLR
jgi:hypothetical protein